MALSEITTQLLQLQQYYSQSSAVELIAVFASLAYVVFAAKGSIFCWFAAMISTVLYTIIFYDVYLWMDSALQLYYLLMAVYGWWCWRDKQRNNKKLIEKPDIIVYQQWQIVSHGKTVSVLVLLTIILGWLMANYTPTHFPYLDSATTLFSVYATYLLTQKVVENWLYFIVIDFVSIYLYIEKGLMATALLFVFYVIIAIYGYQQWLKHLSPSKAQRYR